MFICFQFSKRKKLNSGIRFSKVGLNSKLHLDTVELPGADVTASHHQLRNEVAEQTVGSPEPSLLRTAQTNTCREGVHIGSLALELGAGPAHLSLSLLWFCGSETPEITPLLAVRIIQLILVP